MSSDIKGELEVHEVTPSSIRVVWEISDFLSLSNKPGYCASTREFRFAGFDCKLFIHPYGTEKTPGITRFSITCWCEDHPNPKVIFDLALKKNDGMLYKSPAREEKYISGENGTVFICEFPRSEINDKKESLIPGGVLTMTCGLNNVKNTVAEGAEVSIPKQAEASIPKEEYPGDFRLAYDLKSLLLSGENSDATINVKGEEFKVHMVILGIRAPFFASSLKEKMTKSKTDVVALDDSCDTSTFRAFLHYLYTGRIENVSRQKAFDLYVLADKYKLDELKQLCLNCPKNADELFLCVG